MSFHVGQKVVCIRCGTGTVRVKSDWPDCIRAGEVYTIREIDNRAEMCGLRLEEYFHPSKMTTVGLWETAFPAQCFRPVHTTNISIFTSMLTKPPAKTKRRERA